ncbi:MAG: SCO6745 family protein [Acidimicrobiales bacterium]
MLTARDLRDLAEPIAATVYFAQEAKEAYEKLGLSFVPGYFCSRSACMGKLPGEVVAAVFGSFNPDIVAAAVRTGWGVTDSQELLDARLGAATRALRRILTGHSREVDEQAIGGVSEILREVTMAVPGDGRPLFAALRTLPWPDDPVGALFRGCDLVRERRGDSHVSAWVSSGLSGIEILILTELWYGVPGGSFTYTRGWSQHDADAAVAGLTGKGLMAGDGSLSAEGRQLRDSIEDATDSAEASMVSGIPREDQEQLVTVLKQVSEAVLGSGEASMNARTLRRPTTT